ncbi:hypothetical protein KIN20_020454 [Parelaphostrongylus tenuis]|uniref:Peptidase M12A domain-containing protein n=1 Tax=Parelaphostrongylus tenuis TaxID=148309 RepID=A0AAD5MSW0_PARTN|nr:hypothetical protein KIN20_020454 [Parelaphostrongylus tenuis]
MVKQILPEAIGKSGTDGQRIAFSDGDIRKINKLYQCADSTYTNAIADRDQLSKFFTCAQNTEHISTSVIGEKDFDNL